MPLAHAGKAIETKLRARRPAQDISLIRLGDGEGSVELGQVVYRPPQLSFVALLAGDARGGVRDFLESTSSNTTLWCTSTRCVALPRKLVTLHAFVGLGGG